ncbi:protein tiptop-like isoform X2 [Tachypleus tridentatus]
MRLKEGFGDVLEESNYYFKVMDEDGPLDFSLKKEGFVEPLVTTQPFSPVESEHSPNTLDSPLDLSIPYGTKTRCTKNHLNKSSGPRNDPTSESTNQNVESHYQIWNGGLSPVEHRSAFSSSPLKLASSSSPITSMSYSMIKDKSPTASLVGVVTDGSLESQPLTKSDGYRQGVRQNTWQNQWISRNGEQNKDVFTCVWCKKSFQSLAEMTIHMKHSPRCGMTSIQASVPFSTIMTSPVTTTATLKCSTSSIGGNYLLKEHEPLPRKLVRGQDIWLGKGAEQTKEILKCMWCGQSFKTLADMTTHMRVTQHYINIISQEQLISWRTPEDQVTSQPHLNAVLTCNVCDQTFGSLKELSYHMVKNAHYKEHILRSITEGGGRRRHTKERRKKSLPVRKLLELERIELNKLNHVKYEEKTSSASKVESPQGRVSCEECGEKVDATEFVFHIKSCAQSSKTQDSLKSTATFVQSVKTPGHLCCQQQGTSLEKSNAEVPNTNDVVTIKKESTESVVKGTKTTVDCDLVDDNTSVLSALEKLIEKSFENDNKKVGVCLTGILQRLGIDEEVYPPWHSPDYYTKTGHVKNQGSVAPSTELFGLQKAHSIVYDHKEDSLTGDSHSDDTRFCQSRQRSVCSESSVVNQEVGSSLTDGEKTNSRDTIENTETNSDCERKTPEVNICPNHSVRSTSEFVSTINLLSPVSKRDKSSPESLSKTKNTKREWMAQISGPLGTPNSPDDTSDSDARKTSSAFTPDTSIPTSCETPLCSSEGALFVNGSEAVTANINSTSVSGIPSTSNFGKDGALFSVSDSLLAPGANCTPSFSACGSSITENQNTDALISNVKPETEKMKDTQIPSKKKRKFRSSFLVSSNKKEKIQEISSGHPLKELQKLLDKTDASIARPNNQVTRGSLLEFSWACNDAATSDSLLRCAFCDTHFISKGAYRHHLSKAHFVKDGNLYGSSWKFSSVCGGSPEPTTPTKESPPPPLVEESPHSKFLKYTELAKQLSSKYV